MKQLYIFFLVLLFSLKCIAQTDTLEQKLIQYKKLFDAGLITEKEYQEVKAKTLEIPVTRKEEINIGNPTFTKVENQELVRMRRQYKTSNTIGTVLAVTGSMLIFTALAIPAYDNLKTKNQKLVIGVFGGLFSIGSIFAYGTGAKEKKIYRAEKDRLGVSINQNGIGLCFTFN